jgi:hypothetical protein
MSDASVESSLSLLFTGVDSPTPPGSTPATSTKLPSRQTATMPVYP